MVGFLAALIGALSACARSAYAGSFLSQKRSHITKEGLEYALFTAAHLSGEQLERYQAELRPMYMTLPKNEEGRLQPSTVRYALHRYFVHKHGWYVKGLDPLGESWNSTTAQEMTEAWAPGDMSEMLERRLNQRGLDLFELASFAATLSDLIFSEGVDAAEDMYDNFGFPFHGTIEDNQFDMVIRGYMATLISAEEADLEWPESFEDVVKLEVLAKELETNYPDIVMWLQDLRRSQDWHEKVFINPFAKSGITWGKATEFMRTITENIGSLTRRECLSVKDALVDIEDAGSGRVKLRDFYSNKKLHVHETVEYLRYQGVIEEIGTPRLIIPNYINSRFRCQPFSSFFSVCCQNACESLQDTVEKRIVDPFASVDLMIHVISHLSSDTVTAPRNLSSVLVDRLHEIAAVHQGRIPLHSRLFMQWMHHAFPRECPFPHMSGTVRAATQMEWLDLQGEEVTGVLASAEEIERHLAAKTHHNEGHFESLPWSREEELVAAHLHANSQTAPQEPMFGVLRPVMTLIAFMSLVLPLVKATKTHFTSDKAVFKDKKQVYNMFV